MIPSVIGAQVRRGIEEFLRTTFPITNPYFAGALDELLARPGEVFRGPYISLKLPFTSVPRMPPVFPGRVAGVVPAVPPSGTGVGAAGLPRRKSTVVATGTGSGKTECFLYPILDYCYQHRNQRGIKAILIYPMNALATDQAGRIAEAIYRSDALRGRVTAGLYLGEQEQVATIAMTESRIITDRDTMRLTPPDILLTNYKMLDYLLLRPKDLGLWRKNRPETLRYLVVDELHTFDGAQGADVACLIRRLKERLRTPKAHLICVGTSATLGSDAAVSATQLVEYAGKVFGETFDAESVIGESVQTPAEFLAGAGVRYAGTPGPEAKDVLNPLHYGSPSEYLDAQRRLWFGDAIGTPDSLEWQLALAGLLRSHGFLRRLLACMTSTAMESAELVERAASRSSGIRQAPDAEYVELVLGSFLALVSAARIAGSERTPADDPGAVSVLDAGVGAHGLERRSGAEMGVRGGPEGRRSQAQPARDSLPRMRADRVGRDGEGRRRPAESGTGHLLPRILRFKPEVRFLFPGEFGPEAQMELPQFLCPECLHFGHAETAHRVLVVRQRGGVDDPGLDPGYIGEEERGTRADGRASTIARPARGRTA